MIDEKKLINYIKAEINPYGKPFNDTAYEFGLKLIDYIEAMEKQPQVGGWIPVSYHAPVEEDGEDMEYAYILDCPMPEEGQEILVSFNGMVDMDVCCYDEGWYLDNRGDWTDVDAWMPLLEPFKESEEK